ncbi:hypothetical protein GGI42DRAFT_334572 [Trichoderma sp. SZMC 28013]
MRQGRRCRCQRPWLAVMVILLVAAAQCRSQDLSEGPQRSDGRMGGVRCARAYRHQRLIHAMQRFAATRSSVPIFHDLIH